MLVTVFVANWSSNHSQERMEKNSFYVKDRVNSQVCSSGQSDLNHFFIPNKADSHWKKKTVEFTGKRILENILLRCMCLLVTVIYSTCAQWVLIKSSSQQAVLTSATYILRRLRLAFLNFPHGYASHLSQRLNSLDILFSSFCRSWNFIVTLFSPVRAPRLSSAMCRLLLACRCLTCLFFARAHKWQDRIKW